MKSEMVQDLVKRNFELGKEIERLQSELDDANESISNAFLIGVYETRNVTKRLRELLIQAKPWVDSIDDLPGEEAWAAYDTWKKQYNELMGEEKSNE